MIRKAVETHGDESMTHSDFPIGEELETQTGTWRCTDVGTRTIVVIKVSDHDDPSWSKGPPTAVAEVASIEEPSLLRSEHEAEGKLPEQRYSDRGAQGLEQCLGAGGEIIER